MLGALQHQLKEPNDFDDGDAPAVTEDAGDDDQVGKTAVAAMEAVVGAESAHDLDADADEPVRWRKVDSHLRRQGGRDVVAEANRLGSYHLQGHRFHEGGTVRKCFDAHNRVLEK